LCIPGRVNKHETGNEKKAEKGKKDRFVAAFVLIVCHYWEIDENLNVFEQIFDDLIYILEYFMNQAKCRHLKWLQK
jgi:hypothetical protein